MKVPGFVGESALYRTTRTYRGYGGTTVGDGSQSVVPAQLCGADCYIACAGLQGGLCSVPCAIAIATCAGGITAPLCFITLGFCLVACGGQVIDCILGCPSCSSGPPPPPPPPTCCPPGRPRCCGSCRPRPDGTGTICDGTCIGRGEQCQ
jgi:hypothetical protein